VLAKAAKIYVKALRTSVVDPYSFFPDPDPEFDVGDQYGSGFRIRIQYGSRALRTKN
jgi:hypothetical protein